MVPEQFLPPLIRACMGGWIVEHSGMYDRVYTNVTGLQKYSTFFVVAFFSYLNCRICSKNGLVQ